ncbi:NAD(P)-dependent oxidoreductase [Streptomyces sp. AS58]|uniref:NAD(P)-dependent oxidoreductase n=1 Tax=Streptomyces sp. AS58 TaxID=1519489 RepID=UPI0006B02D94|nr:NAD(P)H-binding protein [Streptomyces sp. AS58]
MSKIAVFGASGTIGTRIVDEALNRGHHVTAVVRDPSAYTKSDSYLTVVTGDVLDPASVASVAHGQDVVVSAVGGGDGPGHLATIKPSAESLIAGLRRAGDNPPLLIAVGGAGSLRTPTGDLVWDADGLPEDLLQVMHAHGDALDLYRTVTDVPWTNCSPPATIEPGERTGTYRTDLDDLIIDDHGNSHISTEDYAVALIDEIENPQHTGERFTVGY